VFSDFASGPLVPSVIGALLSGFSLSLFIFTTGPSSGGHINPLITLGTFFGRLSTFPRSVLYIIFQTAGATIAGFLIRAAGVGPPFSSDGAPIIPGCTIDAALVPLAEAYVLESLSCLTIIHYAFGIGLDPRQKVIYGPALGPILIGLALALVILATAFVKEGYAGASMNPARCFGLMAAVGGKAWHGHWVHWVGALTGSLINGGFYWLIPPGGRSARKR
jgi:glycerol uptake facilitator-like aquaporin